MKSICLLGGMSWESTKEYYRLINERVEQNKGPAIGRSLVVRRALGIGN